MLVTNGFITRNISPEQLREYEGRGYKPLPPVKPEAKAPAKKGRGNNVR